MNYAHSIKHVFWQTSSDQKIAKIAIIFWEFFGPLQLISLIQYGLFYSILTLEVRIVLTWKFDFSQKISRAYAIFFWWRHFSTGFLIFQQNVSFCKICDKYLVNQNVFAFEWPMLVWFRTHACAISYSCLYDFVPMLVWFRTHACVISYPCLCNFVPMLVWFRTYACMISYPSLYDFVPMLVWFRTHACVISYSCLYDFVPMLVWFRTHACMILHPCLCDFVFMLVWFRTRACMISYSCLYDFVLCHWKANRQLPFSPMITSTISKICRMNKKLKVLKYFLHTWKLQKCILDIITAKSYIVELMLFTFHLSIFSALCDFIFLVSTS